MFHCNSIGSFQDFFLRVVVLSCFVYPILAALAFALHPNLFCMSISHSVETRISEFHHNRFMHFGHFLLVVAVPFLMLAGIHFAALLYEKAPLLAGLGFFLVIFGCFILILDKSALCFVPSALDTLSEDEFSGCFPGIRAIFSYRGYLKVLQFLPVLPLGFILIGIGLVVKQPIPLSQGIPILVGAVLMMNPDIDLLSMLGSVSIGIGFIPYAVSIASGN